MISLGGIELNFGKYKGGLWYDDTDPFYCKPGFGIKLALRWGPWICPIPKFWKWDTSHRWGENTWFTLKGSFTIFPFISIALGKWGAYAGAKDNGWDDNSILILSAAIHRKRK